MCLVLKEKLEKGLVGQCIFLTEYSMNKGEKARNSTVRPPNLMLLDHRVEAGVMSVEAKGEGRAEVMRTQLRLHPTGSGECRRV